MPAAKRAALPVLQPTTPEGPFCDRCAYQSTGVRRVLPDGSGSNGVMLVGDSPFTEEVAAGRPFVGPSGKWLDTILSKRGLVREDFLITNSLWCKPPHLGMNDNPERYPEAQMAARQCRPYLDELIKERNPKVLVPLGNVALKRLTGFSDVESNHSYIFNTEYGIPAVPTFHPSGILQGNHNLTIAVILGIARALEIANGTFKETKVSIVEDPDPSYIQYGGRGDLPTPLMCDIETPKSIKGANEEEAEDDPSYQIVRMGFSVSSWSGVSFPFEGDYIRRAKDLVKRARVLLFWNKNYDLPRLKAAGFELHPSVEIVDAMWCLQGRTKVRLYNGDRLSLATIVDGKLPVILRGMDEQGNIVPVKVVDWHKRKVVKQKWLRIKVDNSKYAIWATPEHKIWTARGWVRADEVQVGDFTPIPRKGSVDCIVGTVLGDGYISEAGSLNVLHSSIQERWAARKARHFGATLIPTKPSGKSINEGRQFCIAIGKRWRSYYYPYGTKLFRDGNITSAALAVWFCDDGSWQAYPGKETQGRHTAWVTRTWKAKHGRIRLCIEGFSDGDRKAIRLFFIERYKAGDEEVKLVGKRVQLEITREARDKLFSEIAAFVPEEMGYKLPMEYRGQYNGWLERDVPQWGTVISCEEDNDPSGWRSHRYCVTVDHPTHRFFTEGGLVSNCWHWLYSDLPKALAFAAPFFYSGGAWKYLASQRPAYYNAMDNAIQMGVYFGVKKQLEADGRWDRFWNHCVKVDPIYVRMGEKGVKVDKAARSTFMEALEKEALAELIKVQELVPPSYRERFPDKVMQESFKELKLPKVSAKVTKRMYQSLIRVEKVEVPALHKDGTIARAETGEPVMRPLWRRGIPFNPRSRPDMLRLMHVLGVKVPKARGEDRESVEAKYLKRLTKFPIFRHCVNYGQRTKLISTYNWPLDKEDRATSQYGYHPSTWRSSSRKVNLGNIPKRFELAKLYRRLLIAEAGCKLIEIDRSAIEAVLVGYWGKSPEYINLAKAGVHSMLVSHVIGRPVPMSLPFADLKRELKEIKKVATVEQYEGCKRCIHGSNYLLSAYGMHDEYEEFFPTEYDAQKMQDLYFNTPAGQAVRAWHKATIEEAYAKKYLDNSFQYRHYFFGPMYKFNKRERKWGVDHEGDAKRAVAFRPQSDAAAIQREDILALEPIEWFSKLLRLPTYDSLVAECPVDYVDRSIELLANQFSKPIAELGGLTIGFEIKVGDSLGNMEEVSV